MQSQLEQYTEKIKNLKDKKTVKLNKTRTFYLLLTITNIIVSKNKIYKNTYTSIEHLNSHFDFTKRQKMTIYLQGVPHSKTENMLPIIQDVIQIGYKLVVTVN